MADLSWLWGALAGGAAGLGTSLFGDWVKLKHSVDVKALESARAMLDDVVSRAQSVSVTVPRDGRPDPTEVTPRALRDAYERVQFYVQRQVPDDKLTGSMATVDAALIIAEHLARDWTQSAQDDRDRAYDTWWREVMNAESAARDAIERTSQLQNQRWYRGS